MDGGYVKIVIVSVRNNFLLRAGVGFKGRTCVHIVGTKEDQREPKKYSERVRGYVKKRD